MTPPRKTRLMRPVAQIAQSVEQGIENPRVGGSIPSLGTTNTETPESQDSGVFYCLRLTGTYLRPSSSLNNLHSNAG
ncbi:hypothetical protein EMIT048CA2_20128 [Pseudomonas chlororaphis]